MPRVTPLKSEHEAFARAQSQRRKESVRDAVRDASRGDPRGAALVSEGEVEWLPFGPDGSAEPCLIVGAHGPIEPEYAAIRGGAALIDANHRGTLRLGGSDRRDFLNRMLTQDFAAFPAGSCRESFWLNRKGRIDADMLLVETGDEILADVDVFAAETARAGLDKFLFAEDVQLEDRTEGMVRLSLHGPKAAEALMAAGLGAAPPAEPWTAVVSRVAGVPVVAARRDDCGVPGYELFAPLEGANAVWGALAAPARPIGWEAYNIARIESGTPLFRIDYGADALPHETGVIERRVSMRKGCYLGQEIVARMESLGEPKQIVVGFRVRSGGLPLAGAPLRPRGETLGNPIGAVTSSTLSPLLGGAAIGFATVRFAHADPGTMLAVSAEGAPAEVEVVGPPRPFVTSPQSAHGKGAA